MAQKVRATQHSQRDLLANVTHELKTPLTSIQGFAQAIKDGAASEPDVIKRSASIIYDEAARMNRMVGELLDLARIESGRNCHAPRAGVDQSSAARHRRTDGTARATGQPHTHC